MKKLFFAMFVLMASLVSAATPEVTSVDMYPFGTKMVFTVDAAPELTFRLPATFDINSIRPVKSDATVDYFRKTLINNGDLVPDFLQELHAKIKETEASIAIYEGQIKANEDKMRLITMMIEKPSPAQNTAEYATSLTVLYEESIKNIKLFSIQLAAMKDELVRMHTEYQNKLPAHYGQEIEISLGATGQGNVNVEAFSNLAGWAPSYRLDLVTDTGGIESTLMAKAHQNTGIDYAGTVTFYTQNPIRNVHIFEVQPLLVSVDETIPTARGGFSMSNRIMGEAPMPELRVDHENLLVESLVNMSVKGRANLRGDDSLVSVDLGEHKLNSKLKVALYRDFGREGHLVAVLENIAEPFLAGEAELSVDGQSSGFTMIANYGRGENIEIPFGRMPLVKINKKSNTTTTATGVFSGGTVEDGYILEVVNGSKLKLDIELRDRIPYATSDKVTVDNVKIEPRPTTNEENVLMWKMNLAPGESRKITVNYRIKHPADKELHYQYEF